jgi:mono/diheme cytochrome c family protein
VTSGASARESDPLARQLLTAAVLAGAVFLLVLFYASGERERRTKRLEAEQAARRAKLLPLAEVIYMAHCSECHGFEGGGGEKGPALRSKSFLEASSDEMIAETIRAGRKGTEMKAWGKDFGGHFSEEEIEGLVAFIRSWEASAPSGSADPRRAGAAAGE